MTYDNVWTLGFYAGETLLPMTEAFLSDSVDKLGLLNFVVTAITYVMSYNYRAYDQYTSTICKKEYNTIIYIE